jgi:hypothetical protein
VLSEPIDAALSMSLPLLSPDPVGEMYRLGMANPLLLQEVNLDQVAMLQGNTVKPALCRPSVRLLRWTVMGFCYLAMKSVMAKRNSIIS